MKKSIRIMTSIISLVLMLFLIGCGVSNSELDIVQYTVTFNSNEGSTVDSLIVDKDTSILEPAIPNKEENIFNET